MDEDKAFLHRQLVKLGDMMGDGLHLEPGGKWISQEYRKIAQALGIIPKKKRSNNSQAINERMAQRVKETPCSFCNGKLKQTRSGSMRARCVECGKLFGLLKSVRRKN
ncbi:MAG: hypothetical protein ACK5MF_15440 [Vibrio sp.]|uniref:hypothetical protein n=1 Tax=Vibrio sp. TaxID=678 RepID=UPI003A86225E